MTIEEGIFWAAILGVGGLFALQQLNPRLFRRITRSIFSAAGYKYSPYRIFKPMPGMPYMFTTLVFTPDGEGYEYADMYQNKEGGWVLELESGVKINTIDPNPNIIENENIAIDNIWAFCAGNGKVFCNIDSLGRVHPGWRGVGDPKKRGLVAKNLQLLRQVSDLTAMLKQERLRTKEEDLADVEHYGKMFKVRKTGEEGEETAEVS